MITLLQPPPVEPLELAEIKAHLRIDHMDEDSLLQSYLQAARRTVEDFLGRALIMQRWQLVRDQWPENGPVCLPKPPLLSVEAVRLIHRAGETQILDPLLYRVESRAEPGFLVATSVGGFPKAGQRHGGIEIDFSAGYGPAAQDIPAPIRHAILLVVASLYQQRGGTGHILAQSVRSLLGPYRMVRL
ncbi:hypothetical protein GCM10007972_17500 [Iodidimonas muriae]|uniref:Phage gp6-like head-tail connector protein n=1 Tax=Iodidimonas muriae TaxID=261467 RepID=A0ABQ2LDK0_9PROT|nr:head-tail connector protein [Iodidimonas muriae]GER08225.1 hypothetical protein JCM17843_25350 [Kordiimonadales bacterium JCM 17843]GGO12485.1 hypothetical protein GCM10007972_17500 [Iodidimonas muriae]